MRLFQRRAPLVSPTANKAILHVLVGNARMILITKMNRTSYCARGMKAAIETPLLNI